MADDDRPVEDLPGAIAALRKDFDDFRTTMAARANRLPTGSIEPSILATPKADTLFLQGQIVSRATYPGLWQWVVNNNLLQVGLFGPADGSTTFGLPNFQGRVLLGAGTLGTDTYAIGALIGAARPVIASTNLPTHDHGTHGNHSHNDSGFTNTVGNHGSHHNGNGYIISNGSADLAFVPNDSINDRGGHNHTVDTGFPSSAGGHTAFGSASPTGLDVRQPSLAVNFMIWT